jgi:hypothetical protein
MEIETRKRLQSPVKGIEELCKADKGVYFFFPVFASCFAFFALFFFSSDGM